ncbi:hypothetical protein LGAA44_380002 [Leuconostoc gasicomitatum]|nr:hypothetical protein LGAA44_380002 [Leuconostoc gasicomitatum]
MHYLNMMKYKKRLISLNDIKRFL